MINPLDKPGTVFELALMNPNPKSTKTVSGPKYKIEFEVEREIWDCFMDANTKGMLIAAQACVADDGQSEALVKPEAKSKKGPFGKDAQRLIHSGFDGIRQVWAAIGSDEEYQAWCRTQKCVVSGDYDYSEKYPEGRCVYAHVRRADNSGTAYKPEYSGVPMKQEYHALQHSAGESAVYDQWLILNNRSPDEHPELDKSVIVSNWFNQRALWSIQEWVRHKIKEGLGIDSLTWADPVAVRDWCRFHGIEQYLPKDY